MPLTKEQNELLTRVDNGAPMGDMIRQHYWIPAVPSVTLVADGAPVRVRLLGRNYVAFRDTSGVAGILDEQCPHRKASLLVGRNEEDGLRCLYHGWKFNVKGDLVEAPNHAGDQQQFCKAVRLNRYQVQERAGIVWVWLGKGEEAPPFPDLPFNNLPEGHTAVTTQEVPTNWVQGVEATVDTTHVSFLHSSTVLLTAGPQGNQRVNMTKSRAPRLEYEDRPYGFRYVALRAMPEGNVYARVNNFVMPWYGIICAPDKGANAMVFFSVPVDDTHHRAWFVPFNPDRPLGMNSFSLISDPWRFPPLPPGTPDNNWGQDRELMKRGHFSGFPQHLATEDFSMFLGQGPIYDRTDEQLCSADGAVVRMRQCLLKAVGEFMEGKTPYLAKNPDLDYRKALSVGGLVDQAEQWRDLLPAD